MKSVRSSRGVARERLALVALVAFAAALRFWHLWDIPSPTDEVVSDSLGLSIARGEALPLTDFEPYRGALWNYLLALGYWLWGPSPYVSRSLSLIAGVLTVPAAYLLARELAGKLAGWVAAVLLATSALHILGTSHPAWAHGLVPLFVTLGLWQLHRGIRLGRGRDLVGSGLWLGFALQTHLTSLALLPGVLAFVWLKGRHWLRTRWPYLAGLVALLLTSNIMVYNITTGLDSARRAAVVRDAYARARGKGAALYVGNAQRMGIAMLRTVSGAIDIRARPENFLLDPLTIVPGLLAAGGTLLLLRQGNPLAAMVIASYAALLLIFNAKYEAIPNGRFLAPVLPLAFSGSGALAVAVRDRLPGPPSLGTPVLALAIAALAAISLVCLVERYDQMDRSAEATASAKAGLDALQAAVVPGEQVLLDRNLDRLWLDGGGDILKLYRWELKRRGMPFGELPGRVTPPTGETSPCRRYLLVAIRVDRAVETPSWLAAAIQRDSGQVPRIFWTLRVVPAVTRPEDLGPNELVVFRYAPPLAGSSRAVERCGQRLML
jgi:4-amino-4-deoxy-L-arabinose transferase-like glycosyltransferase